MYRIDDIRQQFPTDVERLTKRPDPAQRDDEKHFQCVQCESRTAFNQRYCRKCLKNKIRKRVFNFDKRLHRTRRIAAEMIDRMVGLALSALCIPMMIAGARIYFWVFVGFYFTFHLLREFVSPGKKLMRLRIVQTDARWVDKRWPMVMRRSLLAMVQTGYFLGLINFAERWFQGGVVQPAIDWLVPGPGSWNYFGHFALIIGFSYDVMSLFFMTIDGQRRRWEDLFTGTVVVDKEVYTKVHLPCLHCAAAVHESEVVCRQCGRERPTITQPAEEVKR